MIAARRLYAAREDVSKLSRCRPGKSRHITLTGMSPPGRRGRWHAVTFEDHNSLLHAEDRPFTTARRRGESFVGVVRGRGAAPRHGARGRGGPPRRVLATIAWRAQEGRSEFETDGKLDYGRVLDMFRAMVLAQLNAPTAQPAATSSSSAKEISV
jgi:hypothetical protein